MVIFELIEADSQSCSMMFLPSYVIVLSLFAFSNLHDLAWGTKVSLLVDCLPSRSPRGCTTRAPHS